MSSRTTLSRRSLHLGVVLLYALVLPLWVWAVRAPDPAYAPLPDYDIRGGYLTVSALNDPRLAEEMLQLRQQRAAKRPQLEAREPVARPAPDADLEATFGADVVAERGPGGALSGLSRRQGPLAGARPGLDPESAAREFLRAHGRFFGLSEEAIETLQVVGRGDAAREVRHVRFRQTLAGIPLFAAELKVSLDQDNAVLAVSGRVFPELRVAPVPTFSAAEAAVHAAGYAGPLRLKHKTEKLSRSTGGIALDSAAQAIWPHRQATPPGMGSQGEFAPTVIAAETSPEEKTTLTRGPFLREVQTSRVIFPLTATQGRPAWVVYLSPSPLEFYQIVVDAEDGALLNRTNLVKFSQPQGLVFLTNPDASSQTLRFFVGDATASPNTFVNAGQTGLQGNNVIMGLGASDTTGPQHFQFTFTNDYELSGGVLNNFNLNGVTLQFTPNLSGGYDLTLPAFTAADPGFPLRLFDDDSTCGPAPAGFNFFGSAVSTICVNSNGNITMSNSDFNFLENQLDLAFGPGRIMGLWRDLNPEGGGAVEVSLPAPDQLCFRWNAVPEFGLLNSNTFSICLFGSGSSQPAGAIQLSYSSVGAAGGMVGISPGLLGIPRTTARTDFSSPVSTSGPLGLARVFPDHDDAAAAATNVFWHLNENGHDRTYALGFTQTAGNMQKDNFGPPGGNDPIVAASSEVFGGFFFNNAFFSPGSDGVCCPVTAFGLFTGPPFRNVDSSFDSDVVVHEHTHGVSTRLVGSLFTVHGDAMGEGWSDWYAISYSGDPVIGEYVSGNAPTGIRRVAYDSSNGRQLGQFGNILGPFTFGGGNGTVFFPEPHADGEIWASMLADLRTALLNAGKTGTEVEELVTNALDLTPPNPDVFQAREALVTAASNLGGFDECTIRQAFANRGLGASAASNDQLAVFGVSSGESLSLFAAFDRPTACGGSFSTGTLLHRATFDRLIWLGKNRANGWTGTGLWRVRNIRRTSGRQAFYYGQPGSRTYNTSGRNQGTLTSPVLNLSGATRPVLEMDVFIATELFFPFDTLWVRLSTDGGTTFPIQRAILFWDTFTPTGTPAFHRVRIDLSPLAGQANARIQLYFDTGDEFFNFFEGIYVDTVAVRNYVEN